MKPILAAVGRPFANALPYLLLVGAFLAYNEYRDAKNRPAPAADAKALGEAYAGPVVSTLADAWDRAASDVSAGRPMVAAMAGLQSSWESARQAEFAAKVAPSFARVLPEGTDPATPAARAEVAAMLREFAAGLRKKGGAL